MILYISICIIISSIIFLTCSNKASYKQKHIQQSKTYEAPVNTKSAETSTVHNQLSNEAATKDRKIKPKEKVKRSKSRERINRSKEKGGKSMAKTPMDDDDGDYENITDIEANDGGSKNIKLIDMVKTPGGGYQEENQNVKAH